MIHRREEARVARMGDARMRAIESAQRDLDEAVLALRLARAGWSSIHTIDTDAVRRALEAAERQLDEARAKLQRALATP